MKKFFLVTHITLQGKQLKDNLAELGDIYPTHSSYSTLEDAILDATLQDVKGTPVEVETIIDPSKTAYGAIKDTFDSKGKSFSNLLAGRFKCTYLAFGEIPTTTLSFITFNGVV